MYSLLDVEGTGVVIVNAETALIQNVSQCCIAVNLKVPCFGFMLLSDALKCNRVYAWGVASITSLQS